MCKPLALLLTLAVGTWAQSNVMELSVTNFDLALKDSAVTLVEFYAPWCGHCKEFAPAYDKAADRMAGKVLVAKVDATVEGELAQRYKISGFPTVKLFKGSSEAGVYQGEKTELALVEWVDSQTDNELNLAGNVLQDVDTCEDVLVRDASTKEQVRYVALVPSNTSDSSKRLEEAALELRKNRVAFNIFVVSDSVAAKCSQEAGCTGAGCWMSSFPAAEGPVLVVSSVFLEGLHSLPLDAEGKPSVIKAWMIEKSVPAVGDIDDDSSRKYFERKLPVFVAFLDPGQDNSELRHSLGQLAAKFGKKFSFVTGDGIKYKQIISAMGMSTQALPQIAIDAIQEEARPTFPFHRGRRTSGKDASTAEALEQFAQDYLDGKLEQVEKQQKEEVKEPEGSSVVELDDAELKTLKSTHEWVAVFFYAPWSSESLDLMPAFRSMATDFGMLDVGFGKNDVTRPSEINRDHSPTVPAVMLFHKGEEVKEPLVGTITEQSVRAWLSKHLAHGPSELESAEETQQWLAAAGPKVLAVLPLHASQAHRAFESVATSEKGYFAYATTDVTTETTPTGVKLSEHGVYAVLENGHTEKVTDSAEFTAKHVTQQLQKLRVPTVLEFGPESGPTISRFDEIPILMVLLPSHDWRENSRIVEQAGADPRFAGRIVFLKINTAQMPQVAQSLGMSNDPNDLPAVRLDGRANKDRPGMYSAPESFKLTVSDLQKFADDYLQRKPLEKILRSADAPKVPKFENGVQVLVGSTFEKEVLDHAGDVAVYYYAPWCQYCTRFTPIFETYARSMGRDGVKFMKVDATENDSPDYAKVEGFPTVYLFKANKKFSPLMYDGQPNENGLREFFSKESTGRALGDASASARVDDEL